MATRTKAVQISIPEIQIKTASLRILGTSPLISHKFSEKARKEILDKTTQKAKAGRELAHVYHPHYHIPQRRTPFEEPENLNQS